MLTDIFAYRYANTPLFSEMTEPLRRLLVQGFRILNEQVQPYLVDGKASKVGETFWSTLNKQLAMELGLENLSITHYPVATQFQGATKTRMQRYSDNLICGNWMKQPVPAGFTVDQHIKERLSLIELGFRKKEQELAAFRKTMATAEAGNILASLNFQNASKLNDTKFEANVDELNARFQQAGVQLNYHNGFIQISQDALTQNEVETPFWALVAPKKWANVDTDMKTAIDLRDSGGRDAVFYAARALESTIKIISDDKKWTHGGERGAANFIDNLASKQNGFIDQWEAKLLKLFFSDVRNPFGHGPGTSPMPALTAEQTQSAIELSMSQCKSLISRL